MSASSTNLPNLPIGLMVLVVDDDEAIANLWQAVLWNVPGLFATTASDGEEAVELARELQPDVILMDLMMPGTDGVAATRRLKSDPLTSQIPVVAVTGASSASQNAIDAGCDDFMVKPLSEAQLVEGIRRVLRIRDS